MKTFTFLLGLSGLTGLVTAQLFNHPLEVQFFNLLRDCTGDPFETLTDDDFVEQVVSEFATDGPGGPFLGFVSIGVTQPNSPNKCYAFDDSGCSGNAAELVYAKNKKKFHCFNQDSSMKGIRSVCCFDGDSEPVQLHEV